jgi:cysteine desulfurase/selenocysteine lyase
VAGVYGFGAALEYLRRLGWAEVALHDAELAHLLCKEIAQRPHLTQLGGPDPSDRAGIASMKLPSGVDVGEVAQLLSDSYRVMCRSGKLCAQPLVDGSGDGRPVLRMSGYVYTTTEEVRTAFEALDEVLAVVGTATRVTR